MALRHFFKPAEQAPELEVDYSYTQWRYAQMLQLERNYRAACDTVEGAATA